MAEFAVTRFRRWTKVKQGWASSHSIPVTSLCQHPEQIGWGVEREPNKVQRQPRETWKVIQVRLQRKEEALSVSASQTTPPPSVLKVLATTLTPGPLFQLRPEEPHSDPLPGSIAPMSHNPV